jgi:hypothetical protein
MTIKSRLTKLESVSSEPWSDEPIIIRIRDKRKGAIQRPSTNFCFQPAKRNKLSVVRLTNLNKHSLNVLSGLAGRT